MKHLTLFLILISCNTFAQTYNFQYYTPENTGSNPLPSNTIFSMAIAPSGYVWMNTRHGITRFNGTDWLPFDYNIDTIGNGSVFFVRSNGEVLLGGTNKYFSIDPNNNTWDVHELNLPIPAVVVCFCEDSNEDLWIGTQNGVVRSNSQNTEYYSVANGLSSNLTFWIIKTSNGEIWVTNSEGIDIFDGTSWSHIDPAGTFSVAESFFSIYQDQSGIIWCGGHDIFYYDGTTWNYINVDAIPQFPTNGASIRSIISDDNGKLYFSYFGLGIVVKNGSNWEFLDTSNQLNSNFVNCSLKDNNGNLWFGFDSGGLMLIQGNQFNKYTTSDGLCEARVTSIYESDDDETLWFSTFHGVSTLSNSTWNSWLQIQGTYNFPGRIKSSIDEKIHVSMGNKIFRFSSGNWEEIMPLGNVFGINAIEPVGVDTFYLGHWNGLSRAIGPNFNYGSSWLDYTGLPDNFVNTLALGPDMRIWIGTDNGLAFTNGQIIVEEPIPGELISNKINDLVFDFQNRLWVATDHGVGIFDGSLWNFITEYDGLINNKVLCLEQTRDSAMWFGTAQGAALLKDSTWQYLTQTDGLLNDSILCIEEDHLGNVWFGTDKGVSELMADTTNSNGINFTQQDKSLNLYPNPASNKLYFKSHDSGIVKIYSLSGQVLLESNVLPGQNQVDLTSLPPGNYFLQVVANKTSRVGKFVVLR